MLSAIDNLFARFDKHLSKSGYLAKGGQIVDATIIQAPRQHNSQDEKAAIKAGEIPEGWKDKPAKLAQKDRDARWTVTSASAHDGMANIAAPIRLSRSQTRHRIRPPAPTGQEYRKPDTKRTVTRRT